ncbi:lysoplasmalogenase [Algoriphagus sediminis]|uniref:Lysoplasmalogenase n=1 Tax=Algoriphagus sediminis TaxID=3057113 RepID=A0ABT7YEA3_9BACT|nr:lysoplasmalogenase [Algoriphagus sediminis]MDN3204822.1 lysoplasmalogenase [Algoriphagus sediminis]
MKDKNIIWLYLFLIATLVDLAFLVEGNAESRIYSKPFILIGLIIYFFQLSKPIRGTLLGKAILSALIFSWIGDVLLLWENLFIYGLGSFLIAQGCYIIGFKVAQYNPERIGKVNFIRTFFLNLPIYFVGAFVFYLINPNLGSLKIPVAIYIIVIVMMLTTARERFKNCNPVSFWQVFIGGAFFLISDAIIALNKFYEYHPESDIMIMGTYAIAQLLIVMGIRTHILNPIKK